MMKSGFTLVELIAVIIILGILSAVGMPQYRKTIERARGAEAYAGVAHIQQAEKLYYVVHERYLIGAMPLDAAAQSQLDINLPQTGWAFGVTSDDTAKDFMATAIRLTGPCQGNTITVDNRAALIDAWKGCVDSLQ